MQIVVSNCRTSLDVVTFRGVQPEPFARDYAKRFTFIAGSIDDWQRRSDAALLGESLAERRGLKTGDRIDVAGVAVTVAGIVQSDLAQDRNVAYVHLPFLQQSAGAKKLGIVTQFNVRVTDPNQLDAVARAIDAEFANDPEPTSTSSEKAFVARAAQDVVRIVRFTQWLGWGCLAAVLALIANAIVLSVQDRIREHAVMQTLGYSGPQIASLIIAEGAIVGLAGGVAGTLIALLVVRWGQFAISNEGLSVPVIAQPSTAVIGIVLSVGIGVLAGLVPAVQASRRQITECFRAV